MRPMRDPAPSRLAYRLNRLMLTPSFRRFLRYGLPVLVIAAAAAFWASDEARRIAAVDRYEEIKRQIQERPEFLVNMMAVDGASAPVTAEVRARLPIDFPLSSFDLDLEAIRAEVERIPAVRAASVQIRAGGVLRIEVAERVPVAVWRDAEGLRLVDETGVVTAGLASRQDRPDLPLIVGEGAAEHVAEALGIAAAAAPLTGRLRALVRIGERRWDMVLDRGQRVLLPEADPVRAVARVMALDAAQDLLARDIASVDFRNPRRPVLRLTEAAIEAMTLQDITEIRDLSQ